MTSLRNKLLANNLALIFLSFIIIVLLVYFSLSRLSGDFNELLIKRSDYFEQNIEKLSSQNEQKSKSIFESDLKKKGQTLTRKDAQSLTPFFEENGFVGVREFLIKNYHSDEDIRHASFFVQEGPEIKAWAYISPEYPNGLGIPIEYNVHEKAWKAHSKGKKIQISDPEVTEILKTNDLKIELKSIANRTVYQCTIPILKKDATPSDILKARSKGVAIGYLRYFLSLEKMEKAVSAEKAAVELRLLEIKADGKNAQEAAEMVAQSALKKVYVLLILGFLIILLFAYLFSVISSGQITGPLLKLRDFAEKVSEGNYHLKIDIRTNDEVGTLGATFQGMCSAILKRDRELAEINQGLEKIVSERTQELKAQLKNISILLHSMQQGVFSTTADGTIMDPVSEYSREIFKQDLVKKNINTVLFKDLLPSDSVYQDIRSVFSIVYGEDQLQWDLVFDRLPNLISYSVDDLEKKIKINYTPIFDDDEKVERILYVTQDVTLLLKMEASKKENESQIERLRSIALAGEVEFKEFFDTTINHLRDIRGIVNSPSDQLLLKYPEVLRNLHSIKGNARLRGFGLLSQVIHEVENVAFSMKEDLNSSEIKVQIESIEIELFEYAYLGVVFLKYRIALGDLLLKWIENAIAVSENYEIEPYFSSSLSREFLFNKFLSGWNLLCKVVAPSQVDLQLNPLSAQQSGLTFKHQITDITDRIRSQLSLVKFIDPLKLRQKNSTKMVEVIEDYYNSMQQSVQALFIEYQNPLVNHALLSSAKLLELPVRPLLQKYHPMIGDLSRQLGKQVEFRIVGDDITLNRSCMGVLSDALTHLVRNSIDHGIELPHLRTARGKDVMGVLQIKCSMSASEEVRIIVSDDGGGIDPNQVSERAISKGLLDSRIVSQMTTRQKLEIIFLPHFSTSEIVSEISGRGVGMEVAKANIEKLGGTIEIESTLEKGTSFIIQLPNRYQILRSIARSLDNSNQLVA